MKQLSSKLAISPEEAEVEERGKDKGQDTRSKTSNKGKTELKSRDANGHTPRDENKECSEATDHEVAHHSVSNTLHMCMCEHVCRIRKVGLLISYKFANYLHHSGRSHLSPAS